MRSFACRISPLIAITNGIDEIIQRQCKLEDEDLKCE